MKQSTMRDAARRTGMAIATVLALALAGPQGSAAALKSHQVWRPQTARHPVSGLRVVPLTITGARGTHRFRVEVAATPQEQEKGLMFRKAMGADEGMIFPYSQPQRVYFWMKNTVLPLDIIYVGTDHRILNIANARPFDETPLASAGDVSSVLEINNGRAAQLGIGPGDRVDW